MAKALAPIIRVIFKVSSISFAVMMLLIIIDVIGRYVFNHPVAGAYEITEFLMVIAIFFSITYSELVKGHVTVDVLVSHLRPKRQDAISSVMYVFFLVTSCVLTWRMWLYALHVMNVHLVSGVLTIPVYPFIFLATFSCALLSLVVLMNLISYLSSALGK